MSKNKQGSRIIFDNTGIIGANFRYIEGLNIILKIILFAPIKIYLYIYIYTPEFVFIISPNEVSGDIMVLASPPRPPIDTDDVNTL